MDRVAEFERLRNPDADPPGEVEAVDFPFGGIYQGPRFADAAGLLMVSSRSSRHPEGSILLVLRSGGSDRQNTWALPGGWIEDGETALMAAVRESQEELGIRLSRGSKFVKNCKVRQRGILFIAWLTRMPVAFRPRLDRSEHRQYRWLGPGELGDYILHEGAEEAIAKLAPEFLEGVGGRVWKRKLERPSGRPGRY
jgi:8-oxo-dGTP pyrophosphatase MutT (NUDIX family)